MDPVVIAAASGGLATQAMKISTTLYSFVDDARYANDDVRSFRGEIDVLFQVLDAISSGLKNPGVASATQAAQAEQGDHIFGFIGTTVSEARGVLSKLEAFLSGTSGKRSRFSFRPAKTVAIDFQSAELASLRQSIYAYQAALQTALAMIHL